MPTTGTHTLGRFKFGGAAAFGTPLLFVACTEMLGIDGEYVGKESLHTAAGGTWVFQEDAQGIAPGTGTGGVTFTGVAGASNNGGATLGNGGIPVGALTGGAAGNVAPSPDSGTCVNCPPTTVTTCPSGNYVGSMSGQHSSSIIAGFRIPIAGTVTFPLTPDAAGTNASVNGTIDGSATIAPNSFASFTATLTGSVNCADGSMKGKISGTYAVAAGSPVPFTGTHEGVFANAAFDGTWSEHETLNPSMNQYFGNGTWSAAAAGP